MSDWPAAEDVQELPLEERLSDAAIAALMGDPSEAGMALVEDGLAEALPAALRALGVLPGAAAVRAEVSVAPWEMARPVVAGAVAGDGLAEGPMAAVASLPELPMSRGLVPAAWQAPAAPMVPEPAVPDWVPPEPVAAAPVPDGVATVAQPARLDWQVLDLGRFAAVPGVAPDAPPAPAAPPGGAMDAVPPSAAPALSWEAVASAWAAPSAAPPGLAEVSMPAQAASGGSAAEAGAPEAPDTSQDEERAFEGRLEIDGALLGRFIAEHLAREAGRPPSGMTGFDPLLSPEWNGALQG
jgi:hypothetical protein